MIFSVIKLSVAALLLAGLSEQSSYPGPCSNYTIPAVSSFDPESLNLKIWHLIATDDVTLPYHNSSCIRFYDSVIESRKVETVETAQNSATNVLSVSLSTMDFSGSDDGSYVYETEGIPDQNTNIVQTDDKTYYVEVSCADADSEAELYVGVFSTTPELDDETLEGIYNYLEGYGIERSNFRKVEQSPSVCDL